MVSYHKLVYTAVNSNSGHKYHKTKCHDDYVVYTKIAKKRA